jgi:hypothetical protein
LGAERSGLSVYELPPGQAVSPYHYEEPEEEWLVVVSGTPTLRHPEGDATVGAVVYPDSDLVWVWTADDALDMVVKRSSKVDDVAPWIAGSTGNETEK